ncbi:L,D-transpeptidase family protein [Tissierella praeacuta]|uniref:L,D-transpeptidase family protein n=1 Tax=Tissierella praeacuta TaxID=43131 RepID=UPI001C120A18|nr:L,D-transpeptidase family protein [Tissierella praeacuta]MBU5256273.1 L,D-transpeptidase family protein [Tissierella praeacuta]
MNKDLEMFILIILLVTIFLILGNHIHRYSTVKKFNLEDVYLKDKTQNYTILVEVDKKQLKLIDIENESIIKIYPIATGRPNSPTPLGTFEIIEKAQWGEGFGTRWMGLNVPWGKYGIHGTNKPGSIGGNLSAGCIRMRNSDVEELYSMVKHNTKVTITNGIYGPFGQGFREIRPGDRGADVLEVQKRLAQKGYYEGSLDGIYGEGMKSSLIRYLKDNDIVLTDKIDYKIYNILDIILME